MKKKKKNRKISHLDCISGCAFNWCCAACWGCWHWVWSEAGTCCCCCCSPTWHWDGGPVCWDNGGGCWDGWCCGCCFCGCCCCCLYRDKLKKRPKMAFRFPFLISVKQYSKVTRLFLFNSAVLTPSELVSFKTWQTFCKSHWYYSWLPVSNNYKYISFPLQWLQQMSSISAILC